MSLQSSIFSQRGEFFAMFALLLCMATCSALAISPFRQQGALQSNNYILFPSNSYTATRDRRLASSKKVVLVRGGSLGGLNRESLLQSVADCVPNDEPQQVFEDDDLEIPVITAPTDPIPSGEIDDLMKEVAESIDVEEDSHQSTASAICRGGESPSIEAPEQPTLAQILKFALPCLALWIAGPLLSLVDTAAVGLSASEGAGATELGALGPATTFIDGATYLFAFLNVATTNLYASALARARQENPKKADSDPDYLREAGSGVARTAIKISLISGLGIMALLLFSCVPILRVYIGAPPGDMTITGPASEYIKVRALSLPTSLFYGVVQAALLGAKDSVTPLIAIVYSTFVNALGDYLLVAKMKKGIVGAAIATTAAQWAGTLALIGPMRRKLFPSKPAATASAIKSEASSKSFLAFAAPVLTLILGKLAAFGVLTHVAAALPGKASLAAHQIILTLFFFVSPFLEVISQTAQAFLPPFYTAKGAALDAGNDGAAIVANKEAKTLALRLMRLGLVMGSVMGLLSSSIPAFAPGILTNDAAVQTAVRPLALPLAIGALLTAPVAVSEGVLLARRDLGFLAGVYLASTALLPSLLIRLVKNVKGPVVNVWWGFAMFQLFRAVCFTTRIWGGDVLRFLLGKEEEVKRES
jgi:Na+-driven multidrug efflux pump